MSREPEFSSADYEVERAIGAIQPRAVTFDTTSIRVRAAEVSARRRVRAWQAFSLLLAVGLAAVALRGPGTETVVQVVRVPADSSGTALSPERGDRTPGALAARTLHTAGSYIQARNDLLAGGDSILAFRSIRNDAPLPDRVLDLTPDTVRAPLPRRPLRAPESSDARGDTL